jgi:hypothetical protein
MGERLKRPIDLTSRIPGKTIGQSIAIHSVRLRQILSQQATEGIPIGAPRLNSAIKPASAVLEAAKARDRQAIDAMKHKTGMHDEQMMTKPEGDK